jgi:hypothetical protein
MYRSAYLLLFLGSMATGFVHCDPASAQDEKREAKKDKQSEIPYQEIRLPLGRPSAVVFSPDGAKMAVGLAAKVVVYNIADGKEVVRMQLPEAQDWHRLGFASDGKTLVWLGYEDKTVRIFDVKTGRQIREFAYPEGAAVQCLSPDATRIVYSGRDKGIDVYDVASNKRIVHVDDADSYYALFTPDGKHVALRHAEKGVRFYDAETGKLMRTIVATDPLNKASGFEFLVFSADGAFMAAWGRENFFDVWDLKTGKRVCSVRSRLWYHTGQFSRDNKSILCTNSANEAVLHHLLLEKVIHRFDAPVTPYDAALTPDEKRIVILGSSTERADFQYSLYLYELPAQFLDPPAARAIDDVELSKLWPDLQSDNDLRFQLAFKAYRAAPRPAFAVFRKEMPPVAKERQKEVEGWIAALDDEDVKRREDATENLQGVAHAFAPLLQSRQKASGPGEIHNRLTFVLKKMEKEKTPLSLVRESRVLSLLEQLATPEARQVLIELADGATEARLTVEARAALQRIKKQ